MQTEVRVGHLGIQRTHPDYMAVNLAIRILGGEGSNRLHQILRTERGLTYGAQANMDTLKDAGDFEAETNTRSDATGEVLRLIVDEFWRLQRERVGEAELASAKAYLTGSFPLTIDTPFSVSLVDPATRATLSRPDTFSAKGMAFISETLHVKQATPEEIELKIKYGDGNKLTGGESLDVVSAWRNAATDQPHVWGAVMGNTRPSGHKGDVRLPKAG